MVLIIKESWTLDFQMGQSRAQAFPTGYQGEEDQNGRERGTVTILSKTGLFQGYDD